MGVARGVELRPGDALFAGASACDLDFQHVRRLAARRGPIDGRPCDRRLQTIDSGSLCAKSVEQPRAVSIFGDGRATCARRQLANGWRRLPQQYVLAQSHVGRPNTLRIVAERGEYFDLDRRRTRPPVIVESFDALIFSRHILQT